ncbi:hypothetical protein H9Q70_014155 [Fusarium xylarioides]|nr:hypothetical protein H9Q70_014155 [Fusarium xylarioides]KAG5768675.1 hypothetical protein H9Q73_013776 [Fusarium xylarioides]
MAVNRYAYNGPIDHTIAPQLENIRGNSVIITGGANGMGEAFVRDFVAAGAWVTFADVNEERGKIVEAELNADGQKCVFIKCDIRDWDQQKAMFEKAKSSSPSNSVDVVIANAGISRSSGDSLWNLDGVYSLNPLQIWWKSPELTAPTDPNGEPTKPDLNIVRVNIDGTFYTWKLAVHYFRQQPVSEERDRCFIITGSMVAWIDSPIKSAIRTAEYEKWLVDRGVEFGEQKDVSSCMLRIATDRSITGCDDKGDDRGLTTSYNYNLNVTLPEDDRTPEYFRNITSWRC